jgi:hypothetical protein
MVEVMGTTDGILRKVIHPQEPAETFAAILHTTDRAADDAAARDHRAAEAGQSADWSKWDAWCQGHIERALAEYRKFQRRLLAELIAHLQHKNKSEIKTLKAQLDAAERTIAGLQAQIDKLTAQSLKE